MFTAGGGSSKVAPKIAPTTPTTSAPMIANANATISATHAVHGAQRCAPVSGGSGGDPAGGSAKGGSHEP